MEKIRGLILEMQSIENAKLVKRDQQARTARQRTAATIAIASLAAAGMVLVAFGLVRRDEIRRDKASREIRDREDRYRFLADSLPQVVWTARPDGKLDYFNNPWFAYSGLTYEQSAGDGWADAIHPEDVPRTYEIWSQSLKTGAPYEREFRVRRGSDHSYRWQLARALPYRDDSGAISQWVGTVTDIDDQRRDAERLRDMNEELERRVAERTLELSNTNSELERSNRELQEFASVASHDLQEPLRKIQAFGDRLRTRSREELGEQGRDYLDRMQASAVRMSTLINDLLSFSRVTTKAQPFAIVDLNEVSREVLSDLEARIAQTGGSVEIGPLPTLEADPLQMRQLIQNLIGNALKFRKLDTPPSVRVTAETVPSTNGDAAGPESYLLRFEDNGIGFDEKYLDRIFNVFQRLHGRGEYEGTGMGLAICRKIVERHGGQITARSTPGEGATFLVTLPASHDSEKDEQP
jgi:PAS domain S-box-containing protein